MAASIVMRAATESEIPVILGWAKDEGWNPGLEDAAPFFASDEGGFFVALEGDKPFAAISVVNHDEENAFLGLYLCRPEKRGQGHGFALWNFALAHAGERSVGLDGVPDQQDNYAKSGFVLTGQTIRHQGQLPSSTPAKGLRIVKPDDLPHLIQADRKAVGHSRDGFAKAWFQNSDRRITVLSDQGGYCTFRQCHEGVKIGPFSASSAAEARALIHACPAQFDQSALFIDVSSDTPLHALVVELGFEPGFSTARMVKGTPPPASPATFSSIATMELG